MEIILLIVLCVLVVVLFVMSYLKRKKYNAQLGEMRQDLKIGDKVMTDTGVVGEVVDSYDEDEYKYFVLKSGKDNNVGYFTVHANAIYYVFDKEKNVVKVAEETEMVETGETKKKSSKKSSN